MRSKRSAAVSPTSVSRSRFQSTTRSLLFLAGIGALCFAPLSGGANGLAGDGHAAGSAAQQPKSQAIGGKLSLVGIFSFVMQPSMGTTEIDFQEVANLSDTLASGSIEVRLIATAARLPSPPDSGPITYYNLGTVVLSPLPPRHSWTAVTRIVPYASPPDGVYYIYLTAFEYEPATCANSDGFCIDDAVIAYRRLQFIGGVPYDAGSSDTAPTAVAVEYYYAAWGYYFVTSFVDEIAALDGGAFGGAWQRTGNDFNVWPQPNGLASTTCRFFSTSFAPRSSHFYTPSASECTLVKVNPSWEYEGIAFYIHDIDANGLCLPGTTILYRLYNNGMGGSPNHRYTTSVAIFDQMIAAGWVFEGNGTTKVFACVPW